MRNSILLTFILCAGLFVLQSCNRSNKKNNTDVESPITEQPVNDSLAMDTDLMKSMNATMKNMVEMKMTGDFDLDFANMLLLHHHGVVDMAQIEISAGSDEKVKAIAKSISDKQSEEIKELQEFLNHHKPLKETNEGTNEGTHEEILASIKTLRAKIKGLELSGNTDKDFVLLMIAHHECAMDLATQEVLTGHHVRLKLMAQNLISEQKKEIANLKKWLANH